MDINAPISAIILDTVLKATVLLTLAWSAALILKKRSAATQHMVRVFALVALLLLPFSVMLLPAWHVKGVPGFAGSTTASAHTASRATASSPPAANSWATTSATKPMQPSTAKRRIQRTAEPFQPTLRATTPERHAASASRTMESPATVVAVSSRANVVSEAT